MASDLVALVVPGGPHVTTDQVRAAGAILGTLGLLAIVVEVIASRRVGTRSGLPLLVPAWATLGLAWWAWSPHHTLHDLAILSIGGYLVVTPAHELLGDLGATGPSRCPGAGAGGRWPGDLVAAWGLSRGRFWERM